MFYQLLSFSILLSFLLNRREVESKSVIYFEANFEAEKKITSWSIFEEIVWGNECYAADIGAVEVIKRAAKTGKFGLSVCSNKANTKFSNHLIAGHITPTKVVDASVTFSLSTKIPNSSYLSTQSGPEFSIQNTRLSPSSSTSIAGIQYIASKYITTKKWNVWMETSPGAAEWKPIDWFAHKTKSTKRSRSIKSNSSASSLSFSLLPNLKPDVWYELKLTANYKTNKYISLIVTQMEEGKDKGEKGFVDDEAYVLDMRNVSIAYESRGWTSAATVITLESENLWNNCGTAGNYSSQIFYDDVSLTGSASIETQ